MCIYKCSDHILIHNNVHIKVFGTYIDIQYVHIQMFVPYIDIPNGPIQVFGPYIDIQ